jgi:hypothetical protein
MRTVRSPAGTLSRANDPPALVAAADVVPRTAICTSAMGRFVAASVTEPRIRPTVWADSAALPNISTTDAPIMARTVNARMGSLLGVSRGSASASA